MYWFYIDVIYIFGFFFRFVYMILGMYEVLGSLTSIVVFGKKLGLDGVFRR